MQGGNGGNIATIPQFIRADFASATQTVFYGMGVIMAVCAVVAFLGLRRGVQQVTATETAGATSTAGAPRIPD